MVYRFQTYIVSGEVIALSDLLVELLDVGEARDEAGGAPLGLLAVEHQLGLLRLGHGHVPHTVGLGRRSRLGVAVLQHFATAKQRHAEPSRIS